MQVRRGIIAAKARLKDPDMQRSLEGDLVDSVELLEHSANLALAALFLVRPTFLSTPYLRVIGRHGCQSMHSPNLLHAAATLF